MIYGPPHNVIEGHESPDVELRFVDTSVMGGRGNGVFFLNNWAAVKTLVVRDCRFFGGYTYFAGHWLVPATVNVSNNLLRRTENKFYGWMSLTAHNNLFFGGNSNQFTCYITQPNTYTVKDNVFQDTCIGGSKSYIDRGHNAYLGTVSPVPTGWGAVGDVTLSSFAYAAGPLGEFYQADTGLKDQGSQTADLVGLSYYAASADCRPEDTTQVDIGFHYLAADQQGLPFDFDLDGMADWWEMDHFGDLTQEGDGDYDLDGSTNLAECSAGTDPNTIRFTALFSTYYFNSGTADGTVDLLGGVPAEMSICYDTDFAAAQWNGYSTVFDVELAPSDGFYDVWIGLRGRSEDSQETWIWAGLTRDTVPPELFITSPVAGATSQPLAILKGYSPEPLASISYDVTTANGTQTDLVAGVTDRELDPVTLRYTTTSFEGNHHLSFTEGNNTLTVRASDLTGNTTTSTFDYVLDIANDTTPPVLTVEWPQDGELVSGSEFTLRGSLDDASATVTAEISDEQNNTHTVAGLVELNGLVWIEGLPLAPGDNSLTITVEDAAGNVSTIALTVTQSNVELTVNEVPQEELITGLATVSGTINVTDHTVWVNGVKVTHYSDDGQGGYNWWAYDVPVLPGGTAVLQAVAIPNADNNGNGTGAGAAGPAGNPTSPDRAATEHNPEVRAHWFIKTASLKSVDMVEYFYPFEEEFPWGMGRWWDNFTWTNTLAQLPRLASGHREHGTEQWTEDWMGNSSHYCMNNVATLVRDISPPNKPCPVQITFCDGTAPVNTNEPPPEIKLRIWNLHTVAWQTDDGGGYWHEALDETEKVEFVVRTGGKRLADHINVFRIAGTANEWRTRSELDTQQVPAGSISVDGKALLPYLVGSPYEGENYYAFPDNAERDITFSVDLPRYDFIPQVAKHAFTNQCVSLIPEKRDRLKLGVGEYAWAMFAPALPTWVQPEVQWTSTHGSIYPYTGNHTVLIAASNKVDELKVTATFRDLRFARIFAVHEPEGISATLRSLDAVYPPAVGAGMQLDVYLTPTNVSFYRVQVIEPLASASGTGYFANNPPQHVGANTPHPVGPDNKVKGPPIDYFDHAYDHINYPVGVSGSYTWPIPAVWRVGGGDTNHVLPGWTSQVFTLSSDGTARVDKLGHWVERHRSELVGAGQ